MQGFVYSGGLVPGMGNNEPGFSGGDPGLNYRFLNIPESNENNYSKDRMPEAPMYSEEADFSLFPCRKECKEKLGGKGFGFRDCIRTCKGKGPRKSILKGKDLDIQDKAVTSLSADDSVSREMQQEGGNKTMWIIIGSLVVVGIAIAIYFLTRKKTEA
jgi:hypothetical protein